MAAEHGLIAVYGAGASPPSLVFLSDRIGENDGSNER